MELPDLRSRERFWIVTGLFLLVGFALFWKLGSYPLFLEEPRRALIALEMYLSDNWTVPTQYGELYHNKPPMWNWIILGAVSLFGEFSEWSVRFFGVVSFLLMGVIAFWVGDKYVSFSFGLHSAFLVLAMADALFYLTVVAGEIDLFYSLITFSSIILIFFLREKGEYGWMFFLGYATAAVGLLTKGLPSLLFLGITILIALWDNHKLKRLWTFGHALGIITFLGIVGWFAWSYHQQHDVSQFLTRLWTESRDKTNSGGWMKWSVHLVTFPFETLKNILPAGLLVIFALRKGFFDQLRNHRLIRFAFWVFLINILVYWLSPQTGSRYLYMLYPFLIMILLYAYHTDDGQGWRTLAFKTTGYVVLGVCLLACILFPRLTAAYSLDHTVLYAAVAAVGMSVILWLYFRYPAWRILCLVAGFFIVRILFDCSVHQIRATDSPMLEAKNRGHQVAMVAGHEPLYLYRDTGLSRTVAFYATREMGRIITKTEDLKQQGLYIIREEYLKGKNYSVYYSFPYKDEMTCVVRFH